MMTHFSSLIQALQYNVEGLNLFYLSELMRSCTCFPRVSKMLTITYNRAISTIWLKLGPSWSWSYGGWIYNYLCNQCISSLWVVSSNSAWARCVLDTTLCDEVCQWLATGRWLSPATPVSSTNKTDHHDITEILLKVALNTISLIRTLTLNL